MTGRGDIDERPDIVRRETEIRRLRNRSSCGQRGANENLNGLIRQYFSERLDFRKIQNNQIEFVQNIINNRPRNRFGFKSLDELFTLKLNQLSKVAFIT